MGYSRSDYDTNPHAGKARNNADHRGWGSGWPNCQTSKIVKVEKAGVRIYVRREAAPLVATLLAATEKIANYDVKSGQTWGYACRAIRGTSTASNHSWGLAVDVNSTANPMGSRFVSDIPPAVVDMWEACGFYWGGRYQNRPDAMHFEYIRRPADVDDDLARARDFRDGNTSGGGSSSGGGGGIDYEDRVDADPGDRNVSLGSVGPDVEHVQAFVGESKAGEADGYFGPNTEAGVKWYQDMRGITVDGIVGPVTWSHILDRGDPDKPKGKPLDGKTVDYSNLRMAAQNAWKDGGDSSVENVQRALNHEFGTGLEIDGIFGRKTRRQYSRWQHRQGFRGNDADGIPGTTTLHALGDKYGFDVES